MCAITLVTREDTDRDERMDILERLLSVGQTTCEATLICNLFLT